MHNSPSRGPLAWMTQNPVAANILMLIFLVGGFWCSTRVPQEVFPEFTRDEIRISVAYPGASPEEIVSGIILPVEEAITGLDNIASIQSVATEGNGKITVEATSPALLEALADDLKNEVDRITTFPVDAEEPEVRIPSRRRSVITLIAYGDLSAPVLHATGEELRDRLLKLEQVNQVELIGNRPLEISIAVSQDTLRAYGLTLAQIASTIDAASLDLPSGTIKAVNGQIQLRMKERRDLGREFAHLPILTTEDGGQVLLADIATIDDGFEETDSLMRYNGKPAIGIEVYRSGSQGPIAIAEAVRQEAELLRQTLPQGLGIDIVNDRSQVYRQRLELLLKNGLFGLILVFSLLGVFLEPRLAFWVTMGIPVSFLGSLLLLPEFGVTINMISLFAFIVTLGIVVDDTIIVGENIYTYRQQGHSLGQAAILGVREMAVPVTFAVMTNIITFLPLAFIPGLMGKIFHSIPIVVGLVFTISLIEALLVLPAHLSHQLSLPLLSRQGKPVAVFQQRVSRAISRLIHHVYAPSVVLAMRYRYVSLAAGIALLLLTGGFVKSDRLGRDLFPYIESDIANLSFILPVGSSSERCRQTLDHLLAAAEEITTANGGDALVQGTLATLEENEGRIRIYLQPPGIRPLGTEEFIRLWRQRVGPLPGLESLQFRSNFGGPGGGSSLTVELSHRDPALLEQAASQLATELKVFPIVSEIEDGFTMGKQQLDFHLNEQGYRLGLTPESVARQIRARFHGHEVHRQIRDRNELKIVVRLPEEERQSRQILEEMVLQTADGAEIPLASVVDINEDRAFTEIRRRDGRRVVEVTAEVTPQRESQTIIEALTQGALPTLQRQFPGLGYSFEGRESDRSLSMQALGKGMATALLIVYLLLAVVFRSYIQPLIIMVAIPFGVVGAVGGHLLLGYSLSLVSFFGIVALSGVVVNDSLVLIDLANRKRLAGQTCYAAVINAAVGRFRPILLTTLTTFFGLMPMIFETSRQAQFLIPMAVSLGFGILFSTAIILVLVPSLYLILDDIRHLLGLEDRYAPASNLQNAADQDPAP